MRWLGRSLALLGMAAMSSCATGLWVWNEAQTVPKVPLTSGLPRQVVEMSPAFDARVKARFSAGTPMADVGLELAREGFVRQDWTSLKTGEHHAFRYDGGGPACKFEALVYWKSDDGDLLTAIRGQYLVSCL